MSHVATYRLACLKFMKSLRSDASFILQLMYVFLDAPLGLSVTLLSYSPYQASRHANPA